MGKDTKSNKDLANVQRRVAIYARVSTEHEAQLYALENQVDWYIDILNKHKNWILEKQYIDKGITGTSAKKRPSFMKMIEDSSNDEFDLIVTREVSRFARNTVDTLQYTRELKRNGIEVYFVEDNIWTFDQDGELRLTLMATLAQDESRKTSLRVKAGQRTSMEKGVYFQNGSVLGYDFDKTNRTLTINPEQAETVRMIFDLYNSGMGIRAIQFELEKAKRKTAMGGELWSCSVISRALKNKIYCGYLVYGKQYVPDFLEQKKVINHGEREMIEVIGKHEPIVSVEEWERANSRLNAKKSDDGKQKARKEPIDIWVKKLRCVCGKRFNRRRYHKDAKNGKEYYGYTCYGVVQAGSAKTRANKGLSMEGVCTSPSITKWKLEVMARYIFSRLRQSKDKVIEFALADLESQMSNISDGDTARKISDLEKELTKQKKRLDNLVMMRADGEISKDIFFDKKSECEKRIAEIEEELEQISRFNEVVDGYADKLSLWRECLEKILTFGDEDKIPDYLIDCMVEYILVDGYTLKWKMRYIPGEYDLTIDGKREYNSRVLEVPKNFNTLDSGNSGSYSPEWSLKPLCVMNILFTKQLVIDTMGKRPQDRIHLWHDLVLEIYV